MNPFIHAATRIFAGFILSFSCLPISLSQAVAEVGVRADLYASYYFNTGDFPYVRSRAAVFLGGKWFELQAAGHYDSLNGEVTDTMWGAALRMGATWDLTLEAGVLQRELEIPLDESKKAEGYYGILGVGYWLSPRVGFYFPVTAKQIVSGELARRLQIDVIPHLALRLGV